MRIQCGCLWNGLRCENDATAEDGLCNWCSNNRTEDEMRADPKALIGPDGEFGGIGGAGQVHDVQNQRLGGTPACWYPDSGRVVLPPGIHESTDEG